MGYNSTLDGEIRFSREVTVEVLEEIATLPSFQFIDPDDDGVAGGIYFDYDEGKFYYLLDDAKTLVKILTRVGVEAYGTIVVKGEENHDVWRLVFSPGTVTKESIEMRWPDGTEYTG